MNRSRFVRIGLVSFLVCLGVTAWTASAEAQSITYTGFTRYPNARQATMKGYSKAPKTWGVKSYSVTWTTPTRSGSGSFSYSDASTTYERKINWQAVVGPSSSLAPVEAITGRVTIVWQNNANPSQTATVTTGPIVIPIVR